MKTRVYLVLLFPFLVAMSQPGALKAQDTQPGVKKSDDLVHSAEFICRKLDELLATMSDVAGLLEKTDPEAAKILRRTVIYAQREDVVNKIDEVKRLLRRGLDQAAEAGQSEVIGDLRHMLRLLEGARDDLSETDERLAEMHTVRNRLGALLKRQEIQETRTRAVLFKKQIDRDGKTLPENLQKLIRRQNVLLDETGKLPEPASAVKKVSELHRAVRRWMRTQRLLNVSTNQAALARLPVLAEAQRKLREQTQRTIRDCFKADEDESIAKALQKAGGDPRAIAKAKAHIEAATQSMHTSAEALEASNQVQTVAPGVEALGKLTSARKILAQAVQTLLARTPAEELAKTQKQLAEDTRALKDAAESVAKKAGLDVEKLPKSHLAEAGVHMNRAIDALEHQDSPTARGRQSDALKALEAELARAEELCREARARAQAKLDAAEQNEITERINETAERMKKGRNGKAMAGASSTAQAGRCSGKAGDGLSRGDAAQANRQQNETKNHLRDAMKSLDDQIERLERLRKAEKLESISERLGKVLERQKACTKQTRAVYDDRAKSDPPYDRPAQQKLAELAGVEGELAAEVQSVRAMLKKEGTTVVFPAVLGDVRRDLSDVRKRLDSFDPGLFTQEAQKEIERTLEELLNSVRKELSKGPGRGGSGGGGGKCKSPLIPPMAELRMLRGMQLHVNRDTKRLANLTDAGKLPKDQAQLKHKKLVRRQEQVLKLVRDIRAKLQREKKRIRPIPPPEDKP